MNDKKIIKEFLHKHGLSSSCIGIDSMLADFISEMEKGLKGENSSLKMIPAFISPDRSLPVDEPVIVIDAGGTNLRIAVIIFKNSGEHEIDYLEKYQMPGAEKEISADEFFNTFAEYIAPVIDRSDKIGFCFSYPAEIFPDQDGKLLHWTKDIKVPEVVGEFIGKGLLESLGKSGEGKQLVLLNDTVATMLAGKASNTAKYYSSYIGFILGTGTNTAYVEKNSNITKRDDLDDSGSMAINVESGNFNLAPQGDLDQIIDKESSNPEQQQLEKMISGLYRGRIVLMMLQSAASEGLFSLECADYIKSLDSVSAYDVDMFLLGKNEGPLVTEKISGTDAEVLKILINNLYDRSALMTAVNISAAVLKSGIKGTHDHPVCINIDGSTYYKSVGFQEMTEKYLGDILGQRGISYDLIHVDEAPLLGAAVAGVVS